MRRLLAAVMVGGLLLAGGCSDSDSGSGSGNTSSSAPGGPGGTGGGMGQKSCAATGKSPTAAPTDAVPKTADAAAFATVTAAAVAKAQAFLETLSADQKKSVMYEYTALDTKRCSWSNFPDGLFNGRLGLKLGDLNDAQQEAALEAVRSVSSADGYTQFQNEMLGDDQLAAQGGPGNMGRANYHLVLFGTPSTSQPWTLQFGGHHLAVHVSLGGSALSVSPHFSGAQPISFTSGGQTIRPMGAETDTIFGLFSTLTGDQQSRAKLSGSYDDILMGPGTDTGYPAQEGIGYSELTDYQKGQVKALISGWVGDAAPAYAQPLLDLYTSQLDQTKIAYSGTVDPQSQNAYFRVDGPRVWIEWINTNAAGFHYHTVYRDKQLDYGTGTG